MSKIIKVDDLNITVGLDDGSFEVFEKSACSGFVPAVGMEVSVFKNGNEAIISEVKSAAAAAPAATSATQAVPHQVSKVGYILLCLFFGGIGLHKFYAGHVVLGVLYLLFCWTFIPSIIAFIELIIGIVKPSDANGNYVM